MNYLLNVFGFDMFIVVEIGSGKVGSKKFWILGLKDFEFFRFFINYFFDFFLYKLYLRYCFIGCLVKCLGNVCFKYGSI